MSLAEPRPIFFGGQSLEAQSLEGQSFQDLAREAALASSLERTICQIDVGPIPPDRARDLGRMGVIQWLGGLPGDLPYAAEARRALSVAAPFVEGSPAVAVFCELVLASLCLPLQPLPLALPSRQRRGGAQARRAAL